jgi:hypothetical protein
LDCFYNLIEKKQPPSRVEKIYVKTSFNIPLMAGVVKPNTIKLIRIMSLLQSFIDKNGVNVSQISFIEPIASFHEIQKITKMSFNIPLNK